LQIFKGCSFCQAFGLTEATGVLSWLTNSDHQKAASSDDETLTKRLTSCGRAGISTIMKIVDSNDKEVPVGTVGEVIARGPSLMSGYWNMEGATKEALKNGWLHTGDLGYMDNEKYLYIVDRLKDMIVTGGENVYTREVEDVLYAHPSVMEAAVVGIPDEKWIELVVGVIFKKESGGEVTEEDLINFCKGKIAGYKIPKKIVFLKEPLPKNPSGKILKRILVKQITSN